MSRTALSVLRGRRAVAERVDRGREKSKKRLVVLGITEFAEGLWGFAFEALVEERRRREIGTSHVPPIAAFWFVMFFGGKFSAFIFKIFHSFT